MTYRELASIICREMLISGHAGDKYLTAKMMVFVFCFFFLSSTNMFAVTYVSGHQEERIYSNGFGDKGRHIVHTHTNTHTESLWPHERCSQEIG